jgi:hypothetical protein
MIDNHSNDQMAQNYWPKLSQDGDPLVDAINEMLNSPSEEGTKKEKAEEEAKQSPVPKLAFGNLMEDEPISTKKNAAVVIQKWFRGWSVRRKTGKSAVKHLLGQKKLDKERQSLDYLGTMVSVKNYNYTCSINIDNE